MYIFHMPENITNIDFSPELKFKTSRSGGKGGQNVNKVESRVQLEFDVSASQHLTHEQKEIIYKKLGNRINNEGVLQVAVEEDRSQVRNKEIAINRFYDLLKLALQKRKKRKKTKPSKGAVERRLKKKKIKGEKKEMRKKFFNG